MDGMKNNVIDMHTGKPVENAANPAEGSPTQEQENEDWARRRSLIRRQLWEIIGSSLSLIDGKEYTLTDFIEESGVIEGDSIENGGYLGKVDRDICYKILEILAPLVNETAYTMHQIIDSI